MLLTAEKKRSLTAEEISLLVGWIEDEYGSGSIEQGLPTVEERRLVLQQRIEDCCSREGKIAASVEERRLLQQRREDCCSRGEKIAAAKERRLLQQRREACCSREKKIAEAEEIADSRKVKVV
jgi:hypothetical protein